MTPWSKKLYSCHICKTNYNRQSERIGKDPQLKAWWKSQDRKSRIEWFCKNKKTYEPNKRKAFDEPGHYEEESQTKGYSKKENMYDYLPRDTWLIRQMQLGLWLRHIRAAEDDRPRQVLGGGAGQDLPQAVREQRMVHRRLQWDPQFCRQRGVFSPGMEADQDHW